MEHAFDKRTKKQLVAIALAGFVLLIADLCSSFLGNSITIVKSGDQLYMLRPQMGASAAHLSLKASIHDKNGSFYKKYDITLEAFDNSSKDEDAPASQTSVRDRTEMELRNVMGALNSNLAEKQVLLPTRLQSGATISWHKYRQTNGVMICFLTMCAMGAALRSKREIVKKERKLKEDSVMSQLPEFVNRLVLLLNAGMVLNSAFNKSMETISKSWRPDDYFQKNMMAIYDSVRATNGSMSRELRAFAKESGMKELMRISNIISDNINKGVALNKKLEIESELLWIARKKNCEERGRLAETKLTLPLMMFLMVLIVITVAPALIEL